jgi:Enoyl-(Acyl carrier protein) reductase
VIARQAAVRGITEEAARAEMTALSPLRRLAGPEEVAAACVFLASGGSAAITGEDLNVTHYENLARLDEVVNTRFTFAGFPLKLRGAHGGPTRAVALVG